MKLLIYSIILVVMLAGVASAECGANAKAKEPSYPYKECVLEKPVETVVGDEVTIKCVEKNRVNNIVTIKPTSGTLMVTGYNADAEPLEQSYMYLKNDGTRDFVPRIAGDYMIEVSNCGYSAKLTVGEAPEEIAAPDETGDEITLITNKLETGSDNNEAPKGDVAKPSEGLGIFDFLFGEGKAEDSNEGASSFALFLVGLVII